MSAKLENYQHLGETMIKKFASRGMEAFYCATSADAVKKVRKLIPEGSSVTWGGSATLSETGILDALQKGPYGCIDRSSAKTPEEARALYGRIVCADYFLTSTNAFTSEGELVNVDGNGNRVACLIAGPSHCVRLNLKTPCASAGLCGDCQSPDSICCQVVVTRRSRHPGRITVILVGEELGF